MQFVSADDPSMLRAFERARGSLDEFLKRMAAHDPAISMPVLKIKVEDGAEVEYFWVADPAPDANGYVGTLNSEPEVVNNVRLGQRISFDRAQIYDWSYLDTQSKRMIGNFTACALLTHESPQSAAEFKRTYRLSCDP